MPIFRADNLVALDIARHPTPFFLAGLFQVVVLFAVAFGVAPVVGEVRCLWVGVPVKCEGKCLKIISLAEGKIICLQ